MAKITHEFVVCSDCAIVIANGDTSGLEDPAAHLARMDAHLPEGNVVITCYGDECEGQGFRTDECGSCGEYTATDQWHNAVILED